MYSDIEIHVQLKVLSESMSADEIAAFIGIQYDKGWKKGDPHGATMLKHKENGWVVESRLSKTDPLENHVGHLLERLIPFYEKIRQLSSDHYVEFSCVVYSNVEKGIPALAFEKKIIEAISLLGASLDIDLYLR